MAQLLPPLLLLLLRQLQRRRLVPRCCSRGHEAMMHRSSRQLGAEDRRVRWKEGRGMLQGGPVRRVMPPIPQPRAVVQRRSASRCTGRGGSGTSGTSIVRVKRHRHRVRVLLLLLLLLLLGRRQRHSEV
jgi:hypothetical protein